MAVSHYPEDSQENPPSESGCNDTEEASPPDSPGRTTRSDSPADASLGSPSSIEETDPPTPENPKGVVAFLTGNGKRPIYRDFDLLQLTAIVFLLDQLTKFLVRTYLPFGHSYPATGFFRFTHAENTGSAFGILQGNNTPLIFVSFVGIIVLAIIYQTQPRTTNLLRLSLALQFGGALGNLVDRFRLGAVTDFIDVGIWPIFNLADSSIICGLCLLGWILMRSGNRAETKEPAPPVRDYQRKRRGRCAGCGRYHSGRITNCRRVVSFGGRLRPSRRRLHGR